MPAYGEDLACIHDAGHSGFALGAAPGLLRILRQHGVRGGLVTDLGCGSGRWARELNRAGFEVFGVDRSPSLVRMARRIAAQSRFAVGSLWQAPIPASDAVTSIGECLNYLPAGPPERLFKRVFHALRPGGVFVFDVAGPSRIPANGPRKSWNAGRDWAVLVETEGDRNRTTLTRRIVSFRRIGNRYRRSEEVHRLRLYHPEALLESLRQIGFHAERLKSYGRFPLSEGITGVMAVKGV
ncbi:Methyltransferase family protein [Candidatus Sulfopaludibacter sp. SbA4]|nr:Methyltransferase family protein [Candidatus Sulfopaludibacter sp. SbA4]